MQDSDASDTTSPSFQELKSTDSDIPNIASPFRISCHCGFIDMNFAVVTANASLFPVVVFI